MPSGRKSLKDEIAVLNRYAELAPKYFKFIQEMLDSKNVEDKKWAVERLDKAFVKMVPQKLSGEGDDGEIIVKVISYGDNPTSPVHAEGISTPGVSSAGFRLSEDNSEMAQTLR